MAPKRKQTANSGKRGKATPAPKRRLSGKISPKAKAASKSQRKSATKRRQSSAPKERRKSAYSVFSAERRGEVLQEQGIQDVPQNLGNASKALSKSWSELDAAAKQTYEARSKLEQHRGTIQSFTSQKALGRNPGKVASEIKSAIKAIGKLPRAERSGELVTGLMVALEALNVHMTNHVRAAVGTSLGDRLPSAEAAQNFRKALGASLGDRLALLLQRWHSAAKSKPRTAVGTPTPARSRRPHTASSSSAAPVEGEAVSLDQETRNKVVGIMMKKSASGSGKASLQLCRQIEEELFKACGLTPKEYFRRARSLSFNLGTAEGELMLRVQEGKLSPADLVRMEAEDLASDALREERERERERYFKSEVHLTGRLRKRRRTQEGGWGTTAERVMASGQDDGETQVMESQQLVPQGLGIEDTVEQPGPAEAEAATGVPAEPRAAARLSRRKSAKLARSGTTVSVSDCESDSSSGSDSSSSGSSSSASSAIDIEKELASLLELQDTVPLRGPVATAAASTANDVEIAQVPVPLRGPVAMAASTANDLEIAKTLQEAPPSSSSSSSSDSSEEEPTVHAVRAPQAMEIAERRSQLWAMGFDAQQAEAALLNTKGNLERAVATLVRKPGARRQSALR